MRNSHDARAGGWGDDVVKHGVKIINKLNELNKLKALYHSHLP